MPTSRWFSSALSAIRGSCCFAMLACAAMAQTIPPTEKPSAATAGPPQEQHGPISPAQTLTAPGREKIGLVLNGGGALGLAHVGVLRWLEEHHIPIDIVAGTSMGGLVGGAYATGDSPEEVRAFVEGIDWNRMLSDQAPYQDISYRRKQDQVEFPTAIQFGFDKQGLRVQGGYKSGQQVQLLLDQIALPYSEVTNFDDLPIPFGCVATDLVSGKPHIFRNGSLSLALRSTMSLPGIFSPVHVDNAIYADGGLWTICQWMWRSRWARTLRWRSTCRRLLCPQPRICLPLACWAGASA